MLRTIGVLTIVGVVVLGIGFTAGWFSFGSETRAGETELTFRVDREEVRDDVDDVKLRVNKEDTVVSGTPSETAAPVDVTGGTMTGDVLSVEPTNSKLKLRLATGDERTLVVSADSTAGLYRLKPGDRVELTTVVEEGRSRIVTLRVL
jgi:hypothetical protein